MDLKLALRLSIKAMNNTMRSNGFVPSYLVFGIFPRFPCLNTQLLSQAQCMRALQVSRADMASILAHLRIKQALLSGPAAAGSTIHAPGHHVPVLREGDKRFIGPFRIVPWNMMKYSSTTTAAWLISTSRECFQRIYSPVTRWWKPLTRRWIHFLVTGNWYLRLNLVTTNEMDRPTVSSSDEL